MLLAVLPQNFVSAFVKSTNKGQGIQATRWSRIRSRQRHQYKEGTLKAKADEEPTKDMKKVQKDKSTKEPLVKEKELSIQ